MNIYSESNSKSLYVIDEVPMNSFGPAVGPLSCENKRATNRLVKKSKSPTPLNIQFDDQEGMDKDFIFDNGKSTSACQAGLFTIIEKREWSGEIRIRTQAETTYLKPPRNIGPRVSDHLTSRGARKLIESSLFMAKHHGGYKVFVTATFNPSTRVSIAEGRTSIQKEITRSMDSLQKMYSRGWIGKGGKKVIALNCKLPYCWVVEIPKNGNNVDNPHVHMLLGWDIALHQFYDWAQRVEAIWGVGHCHLEQIRDPLKAGAYLAKAAGCHSSSPHERSQGIVKGNRYGISQVARAPGWHTVSRSEMGVMGKLITEIYDRQLDKNQSLYREKHLLKKQLKSCSKNISYIRGKLECKLSEVQAKLYKQPVRSSKYQLVFKSSELLSIFLDWARRMGWDENRKPTSRWFGEFKRRQVARKQRLAMQRCLWSDKEWSAALRDYLKYERFEGGAFSDTDWDMYCDTQQVAEELKNY